MCVCVCVHDYVWGGGKGTHWFHQLIRFHGMDILESADIFVCYLSEASMLPLQMRVILGEGRGGGREGGREGEREGGGRERREGRREGGREGKRKGEISYHEHTHISIPLCSTHILEGRVLLLVTLRKLLF